MDRHASVADTECSFRTANQQHELSSQDSLDSLASEIEAENVGTEGQIVELSSSATLKSGFLYKKSPSLMRGWQKRWFVLTATGLMYYEDEGGPQLGMLHKEMMRTVSVKADKIEIPTYLPGTIPDTLQEKRTYHLKANSPDDAADWAKHIEGMVADATDLDNDEAKQQSSIWEWIPSLLPALARRIVSKKKNRFQQDGYDLDLTYITERVIAMGYPSEGLEGAYRNPMTEVQSFFKERHPGQFKLFNLCVERTYDKAMFGGHVAHFPFKDHSPPPLQELVECVEEVHNWLADGILRTVAVHCKAGKGRTGTVIACLLMREELADTADKALQLFGQQRTANGKGVTIPSQIRYVHYFYDLLLNPRPVTPVPYMLTNIVMNAAPTFDFNGGCDPYLILKRQDWSNSKFSEDVIFDSRRACPNPQHVETGAEVSFSHVLPLSLSEGASCGPVQLEGDVLFQVWDKDHASSDDLMLQFWVNTMMLPKVGHEEFEQQSLDKACRDRKHQHFPQNFTVTIHYQPWV